MHVLDLKNKNTVIWGTGREGVATFHFIRRFLPTQALTFVDESEGPETIPEINAPVVRGSQDIAALLEKADVVIKSPGVSLYHPLLIKLKEQGVPVTSLLNLWSALPREAKTIYVTGTKGKSTTASLIAHVLEHLGKRTALLGNIGTPVSEVETDNLDYIVIETSSYQAANFDGSCDIAILTSLYPEHLDWHKTLQTYYSDKLNLLHHARLQVVNAEALETIKSTGVLLSEAVLSNTPSGLHIEGTQIYTGNDLVGALKNDHLSRHHNLMNVCTVLAVMQGLGFDLKAALHAMEDFKGLPHRQQELGTKNDILYVNDSISTTPQSAIAAMQAYRGKAITLIVGGHDRGIDYTPLADYIAQNKITTVLCIGPSGARIAQALQERRYEHVLFATGMKETVSLAKQHTLASGVILLSPAAPSYGFFKNFEERGAAFATESGFST